MIITAHEWTDLGSITITLSITTFVFTLSTHSALILQTAPSKTLKCSQNELDFAMIHILKMSWHKYQKCYIQLQLQLHSASKFVHVHVHMYINQLKLQITFLHSCSI